MQVDTTRVDVPVQWLDSLRASGHYNYHQGAARKDLWEWFNEALAEILRALFNNNEGLTFANLLFYAIVIALVAAGIYWFMKGGAELPTQRASGSLDHASIAEEDLREVDFDRRIGEAAASGDLRLAIRYLYLQALFVLDQHAWIVLKAAKTNRDYEREVAQHPVGEAFRAARRAFEHTWYGKHDVAPADFERIRAIFTELQMKARRS